MLKAYLNVQDTNRLDETHRTHFALASKTKKP